MTISEKRLRFASLNEADLPGYDWFAGLCPTAVEQLASLVLVLSDLATSEDDCHLLTRHLLPDMVEELGGDRGWSRCLYYGRHIRPDVCSVK